jgi:hypothetical protein
MSLTTDGTTRVSLNPSFVSGWLEGGDHEGDRMRVMRWGDQSALELRGADLAMHGAVQARQRRGEMH